MYSDYETHVASVNYW